MAVFRRKGEGETGTDFSKGLVGRNIPTERSTGRKYNYGERAVVDIAKGTIGNFQREGTAARKAELDNQLLLGRQDALSGTTAEERRADAGTAREELVLTKKQKRARDQISGFFMMDPEGYTNDPAKQALLEAEVERVMKVNGIGEKDVGAITSAFTPYKNMMAKFNVEQQGKVDIQNLKNQGSLNAAGLTASSKAGNWQQKKAYVARGKALQTNLDHVFKTIEKNNAAINSMTEEGAEFFNQDIANLKSENVSLNQQAKDLTFQMSNIDPSAPGERQFQSVSGEQPPAGGAVAPVVGEVVAPTVVEVTDDDISATDRYYESKAGKKPVVKAEKASVADGNQASQAQREEISAPPKKTSSFVDEGIKPGDAIKKATGEAVDSAVEYMKTSMVNFKKQNKESRDNKKEQEKVVRAMVGGNANDLGYRSKGKLVARISKETGIPISKVQVIVNNKIKEMKANDEDPFKGVGGVS
jgi:hypothetical protein